jgi:LmbE family N-acetylglucosaminyl deacetylase
MLEKENILIVAPHPDDEVLGCGGIMKKFSARGDSVFVLIVTRGKPEKYSESRIIKVRDEALRAHKILGVTETRFFDFPAPDLDRVSLADISEAIFSIISEFKIDTLFLPHRGDIHHDHKIVFNAGLVASRPVNEYSVKRIFSYETLSETEWAAPYCDDAFMPTYFVDISKEIGDKMNAFSSFKSQIRPFPSSRSLENIEALAKFRGATVGIQRAEAFMVIRIIEQW